MKISILTIFPELFDSLLNAPVIKRAVNKGLVSIELIDIKDFSGGSFRRIDDSPYGGGVGMIMRVQPILNALNSVKSTDSHTVLLSPKGTVYNQQKAHEFAEKDHIILICGHYEGVDARVENHIDEQISIGDYILTGGEMGACVIIDSVVRLLKGALRDTATTEESHENGLLEYPQYTRPAEVNGECVPPVLLSGNQKEIDDWRLTQSLLQTRKLRPDLFEKHILTEKEKQLIEKADFDIN